MDYNEIIKALGAGRDLLNGLTILVGVALLFHAFMRFKNMSDTRGAMTSNATPGAILGGILGGTFLIYFASSVEMAGETMFGTSALAYNTTAADQMVGSNKWFAVLVNFIELSGLIAMFRGYLMFASLGKGEQQRDGSSAAGRIATWVFSGALAYNIQGVNGVINSLTNFNLIEFVVTLG